MAAIVRLWPRAKILCPGKQLPTVYRGFKSRVPEPRQQEPPVIPFLHRLYVHRKFTAATRYAPPSPLGVNTAPIIKRKSYGCLGQLNAPPGRGLTRELLAGCNFFLLQPPCRHLCVGCTTLHRAESHRTSHPRGAILTASLVRARTQTAAAAANSTGSETHSECSVTRVWSKKLNIRARNRKRRQPAEDTRRWTTATRLVCVCPRRLPFACASVRTVRVPSARTSLVSEEATCGQPSLELLHANHLAAGRASRPATPEATCG